MGLLYYAAYFIALGILFLLWAYTSYRLRYRFPRYYEGCIKVYDNLPKIVFFLVIAFLIYGFFESAS